MTFKKGYDYQIHINQENIVIDSILVKELKPAERLKRKRGKKTVFAKGGRGIKICCNDGEVDTSSWTIKENKCLDGC